MRRKSKWVKDGPDGIQLHAGAFRGHNVFHSDDGGREWWSGMIFSHDTKLTASELVAMAINILQQVKP